MNTLDSLAELNSLVDHIKLPKMIEISQDFPRPVLKDVNAAVCEAVEGANVLGRIKPGDTVAITAGSRGVSNMDAVIKKVVDLVKEQGGKPFVFPAMGSHGGATAEGQLELLESLHITEEFLGCEIKSCMDTVVLGHTSNKNLPVYIDVHANAADHTILINRIKPHPSFYGAVESGITKMAVVGLGKQKGASLCHSMGIENMSENVQEIGAYIFEHGNVIFGVGLVENAYDETCEIVAYPTEDILKEEPAALKRAYANKAGICFSKYDVLIVDEVGKNISGAGMDTDIIGRYTTPTIPGKNYQQVIVAMGLSEETHGNATGMGMIDIAPRRYFDQLDLVSTYTNLITSRVLFSAKMPLIMETDKVVIQTAINSCVNIDQDNPKIVRVKNTLEIGRIQISEALLDEARTYSNVKILSEKPVDLAFDENDNLVNIW